MKDIVWGKVLSVEVEEIDDDHRKLIDIFNILKHAVTEGESPEYLAAVLEQRVRLQRRLAADQKRQGIAAEDSPAR